MLLNKKFPVLLLILCQLVAISDLLAQYPTIVPGTYSWRLDNDGDVLNDNGAGGYDLTMGHYYKYPAGGNTTFNSSPYQEFAYFDKETPTQPLYSWRHRLNFRIKFPEDYDPSKEYPMMVFMHGLGERGNCWGGGNCFADKEPPKEFYNNDLQLLHGGNKHLLAVQTKIFDGFMLYPQMRDGWYDQDRAWTIEIIDELLRQYSSIDRKRIYIHGLSDGAKAAMAMINTRPDLFAAASMESGTVGLYAGAEPGYRQADPLRIRNIPIWVFQGSNDRAPYPAETVGNLNVLRSYGGTPKYTLLDGIGHGTWNIAWSWGEGGTYTNSINTSTNEYFPWFLQYSKLSIHSLNGITQVCDGDPVNIRMGIAPGFDAYEWKKILGGIETPFLAVADMPNEIIADEVASYAVRYFQNGAWTEWSEPLSITTKARPTILINAQGPSYFPAPNNANQVTLTTDVIGSTYQWFKDGNLYSTNSNLTVYPDTGGEYRLVVNDGDCDSSPSNPIYIRQAPYIDPLPAQPTGLIVSGTTENSVALTWGNQDDNLGFELFRATAPGGPYTFVKRLAKNTIYYKDQPLSGNSAYYYLLRSFNENGASASTSELTAITLEDTQPPSAPTLNFKGFVYTEVRDNPNLNVFAQEYFNTNLEKAKLYWSKSTDNSAIEGYEVYRANGQLIGSTQDTSYTIDGLQEENSYQFYVKAKDISGNLSTASNAVNVNTTLDGLYFHMYVGGTWHMVNEFSTDSYWVEQGTVDNFDISIRSDHYNDNDYFAFDFFGFIYIDNPGTYRFYTSSDDGSQLFIDGQRVVNNDGRHGNVEKFGDITLTQGAHFITVKFFEASGGQNLSVSWRPPGEGQQQIPNSVLRSYDTYTTVAQPLAASNLTVSQTAPSPEPNTIFGLDLTWDHNNPVDVVVLGSSTAAGTGASDPSNSWVGLFTSWVQDINTSSTVTNLAQGGYTSYHIREDGYSVSGKPSPDVNRNITAALNVPGVDIIIVNLPSNDLVAGYLESETMTNLMAVRDIAESNGVQIFFTTTQPRAQLEALSIKAETIRLEFKEHTIDIYNELADLVDGPSKFSIKPTYNSGDGIHLNDAGHNYIFNETVATLSPFLTRFEIYRGINSGSGKEVVQTSAETSFSDLNLDPSTTYYYQIRAISPFGASNFSSEVSGTTLADLSSPTTPTGLTVLSFNDNSVVLSWAPSSDNVGVAGYTINVDGNPYQQNVASGRKATDSQNSKSSFNQKTEGQASTSALVTGLNAGTEYTFTVSAHDGVLNNSANSDPMTQTTSGSAPLPIELVDFYALKNDNGIELIWKTASEINNDYFTIERASSMLDFEILGTVKGAGSSESLLDYKFNDDDPLSNNYYRLKQTDFDGKYEYSKVIQVVFEKENEWIVYPNPTAVNNVNLLVRNNKGKTSINVKIIDLYGKLVYNQNLEAEAQSTFSYQLGLPQGMSAGIYNLILKESDRTVNRKLVLK